MRLKRTTSGSRPRPARAARSPRARCHWPALCICCVFMLYVLCASFVVCGLFIVVYFVAATGPPWRRPGPPRCGRRGPPLTYNYASIQRVWCPIHIKLN